MTNKSNKFSYPVDDLGHPVVPPNVSKYVIQSRDEQRPKFHETFPCSFVALLIFLGWFLYLASSHQ